jgi:hypothetical protein
MSTEAAAPVAPFILARFHGNLIKLAGQFAEGQEGFSPVVGSVSFVTESNAGQLPLAELGELYGEIAGTQAKKFKDAKIAVESLAYQVGKLKFTDPLAPTPAPQAKAPANGKASRESKPLKAPLDEKKSTYVLLTPDGAAEAVGKIPPQARAIVSALADVVKVKGVPEVSAAELEARLTAADSPLTTRQPVMRIVGYYMKKLVEVGLLQVK